MSEQGLKDGRECFHSYGVIRGGWRDSYLAAISKNCLSGRIALLKVVHHTRIQLINDGLDDTRFDETLITKALPAAEAVEVANFIVEEIILKHGAPKEISNRGRLSLSDSVKDTQLSRFRIF
ncbi:hypothetical protein NPIL_270821 [Nephila pilipes]|uniref:Uncharacterized protein n=1 Tax=Nephila pilipes TaxID=299642 RepID=A0A8X6MDM9_NEPPI|nr:hypothetical protein NPIL_270821 [Nephila pilipes]